MVSVAGAGERQEDFRLVTQSVSYSYIEKAWLSRFHRWRGYALSLTGNVTDAEEVVQEAVSRTVRARPKFGSERDAHNYVLTAVRTAALQLFQQRRRLSPLDELAPSKANEEISSDPLRMMLGEERTRNRRHLVELALRLVGDLEPVHREVLELLVLGDPPLKLREVAAIQGAPISTVHSRLQAALLQVGRRMEAESASGGGLEK